MILLDHWICLLLIAALAVAVFRERQRSKLIWRLHQKTKEIKEWEIEELADMVQEASSASNEKAAYYANLLAAAKKSIYNVEQELADCREQLNRIKDREGKRRFNLKFFVKKLEGRGFKSKHGPLEKAAAFKGLKEMGEK